MAWVFEKGQSFMTHVSDVVKASCPKGAFAKRPPSGNGWGGADDNSPHTQEPCVSKEARTDLKQRWRG